MLKGIDISQHNGVIDFEKVVKSGIQFVMIRAGYGKNNIDEQFVRNIKMCNQLELPCGVYWFSYALSEEMARQEALYCLNAIAPYRVEYPVCYDLEYDSISYAHKNGITINKTLASKFAVAFLSTVEGQKYYPMLYANSDYMINVFDESVNKYDLWFAQWGVKSPIRKCGLWQYASQGKIDGITGNSVDLDYSYSDYRVLLKVRRLNRLQPQTKKLDVDGVFGVNTMRALQTYLRVPLTGALDEITVKALQTFLNGVV